jgi:CRISPR-associated endoribonuclease Cas6
MLLSTLLSLQADDPAPAPASLGRAAHAWFLDRVRAADSALADQLHGGQGLRPFTVSDLWGPPVGRPGPSYLRLTSFSPELTALLRQRILPALPERVFLGGREFRLLAASSDPAASPWAAETSYEALVQRHTLGAAPSRLVGLRFASPTAFRVTGKKSAVPMPLPGWVFGGLLDKWNAFAPIQLHPDLRRFADECLVVSSYRLETRPVSFGQEGERGALSGCVGVCRYYAENPDRYWLGMIHLLAGFGLFAGVGLRTTMGLGQARPLVGREPGPDRPREGR